MPTGKNSPFILTLLSFTLALCLFAETNTNPFLCHFFHANIFHWGANAICLWLARPTPYSMVIAYIIALAAAYISPQPFVGISAMLYAHFGFNAPFSRISISGWIAFILINFATFLIPALASVAHTVSFLLGLGLSYLIIQYLKSR